MPCRSRIWPVSPWAVPPVSPDMQIGPLLHAWLILLGCFTIFGIAQVNVTLEDTSSEIVYTPPACNRTLISGASGSCNSAWHIIPSPDSPESTVTSTSGPTIGSGNLVPQVFLTFTGLALYIRTSSLSTAIANITLSTQNPAISITTQVDSAAGLITVIGLLENETTTLAITFVASNEPTQLDIGSFTITLPNNGMSPSILPTLPVSSTLPTFSPIVTTPTQHKSQSQTGADITAEVLGAVLGVVLGTIGAAGITYYYKKRRQRPADLTTE